MAITKDNQTNISQSRPQETDKATILNGLLLIWPAIVTIVASYILLMLVDNLNNQQLEAFSITILSAIVFSLVGTAGMTIISYKIIRENTTSVVEGIGRSIRIGVLYSMLMCLTLSGLSYWYFRDILDLSIGYYLHFILLLAHFSITWVVTSAFWAAGQYRYPAVIFTTSYFVLVVLIYGFYLIDHVYAITGYTIGIAGLCWLSLLGVWIVFGMSHITQSLLDDVFNIVEIASHSILWILFHTLYILAIFLDKIIIWVSEGHDSGHAIVITGPYTIGAFLGLIPIFCIVAIPYFSNRAKPLIDDMFTGTLSDIHARFNNYKQLYYRGFEALVAVHLVLFVLVFAVSIQFTSDILILGVMATTGLGTLFFALVIYDSVVLPSAGNMHIPVISMLIICTGEFLSIPFVGDNVWYASMAFTLSSFLGFVISDYAVSLMFKGFTMKTFRRLTLENLRSMKSDNLKKEVNVREEGLSKLASY